MNIQTISSQPFSLTSVGHDKSKYNGELLNKEFSLGVNKKETFEKVKDTKETLESMLSDINELKDKIDFEMSVENVMKYKTLVKSFLAFYADNALQTQDIMYRNGRRNEVLTVVKKVDEGIEELDDAMALLDTKSGHLDMLKRIDEINGMIVNLRV